MQEIIDKFKGEYAFLGNSYYAPILVDGKWFMCVESAYQSYRICDNGLSAMFSEMTGARSKSISHNVTERKNWDAIKNDVLYKLTLEKFKQNSVLKSRLLSTGDAYIKDDFLGEILMRVRKELSAN